MWQPVSLNKPDLYTFINNYKSFFDYLSIRYEESFYTTINESQFKEKDVVTSSEKGYAVKLIKNNKTYHISASDIADICIRVEEQFHVGRDLKETISPGINTLKDIQAIKRLNDFLNFPQKDKLELICSISEMANKKNLNLTSTGYYDRAKFIKFLDGEGIRFNQVQMNSAFYSGVALNNNNSAFELPISMSDYNGVIHLKEVERELDRVRDVLIYYQEYASPIPSGRYNVILSPALSGVFIHETIGHLSEADTFYNHIIKLGSNFTHPELSVYDVPLECEGFDFDEEGTLSKSTSIIENGHFVQLLHSKGTSKYGNTGNGRAVSYRFPPITRMKQTFIKPGSYNPLELQKKLKDGLYLLGYRGGSTFEGFFNLESTYGYYVKNGRLTNIFKNVNIYGDASIALGKIIGIGKDVHLIRDAGGCDKQGQNNLPNEMKSPSLLIEDLEIGDCLEYE